MRDVIPIMNAPDIEAERKTKCLSDSIIGNYDKFTGPYGDKPIIYADWTASGRCIKGIENYMAETVLPLYGNTHTKTSISGSQTTHFRNDAREIIIKAINATHADDVVVFTGNGSTGAIQKLSNLLRLNEPGKPMRDNSHIPIVFTSCYEHHSNILGW
jgi:selenocysteine lyase/cysteine desulfurase